MTTTKTTYPGIDYSAGQPVNRSTETGIRYGIISSNAVNPDALDNIYSNGTDEDFASYKAQAEQAFRSAMEDYLNKHGLTDVWNSIEEHLGDSYEGTGDCTRYSYEADGYKLLVDSSSDLWVIESPYFTYAQFCSPCAPGACSLTSPLEEPNASNKCYCLGPDWFEDSAAPYPVYDVSDAQSNESNENNQSL